MIKLLVVFLTLKTFHGQQTQNNYTKNTIQSYHLLKRACVFSVGSWNSKLSQLPLNIIN